MNKVFYIHSNILAICCYQTVKEALRSNDKVIIVTSRNCKWPFFSDHVQIYDFSEILGDPIKRQPPSHYIKNLGDYLRYRRYLQHIEKVVHNIIADEDFIFYLPSMAIEMTEAFAYNKHCKGHYYVDEGSIAYLPKEARSPKELYFPEEIVQNRFFSRIKYVTKKLFKIEDHCHFEIDNSLFKGTISITNEAFQWNTNKEKIVNSIDECVFELSKTIPALDDVIVTAYLSEDLNVIINSLDYAINSIQKKNRDSRIGIKIHPFAMTYYKENTLMVIHHIRERYKAIMILPADVSIEVMSLAYHPNLYSLLSLSSLILYGLLFKSSNGYLIKNDNGIISLIQLASVEEYNNAISE